MIPPDDALDLLLLWPPIFIVLDGYEPRLARVLMELFAELDDESARLSVTLWALDAKRKIKDARN